MTTMVAFTDDLLVFVTASFLKTTTKKKEKLFLIANGTLLPLQNHVHTHTERKTETEKDKEREN